MLKKVSDRSFRVFRGARGGSLLQAIVRASGVLWIPMPCAVTGVFLVLCRLDFIAAAGGDQAGKEEKVKTRFHCVYLVIGLCFLVTEFVVGAVLGEV